MFSACDSGKFNIKSVSKKNNEIKMNTIRNKMDVYSNTSLTTGDNDNLVIEYKDNKYFFGKDATNINLDTTKAMLNHKLGIFASIANFIDDDMFRESIDLAVSVPLSTFINADNKNKFVDFLKEDGNVVDISINDKRKIFLLGKILVFPETIGCVFNNMNYFKNQLVGVCDIGGLNTNGAIYNNCGIIKESAFTTNEGTMILSNKIKTDVNIESGGNYQDYHVPYLIQNKHKVAEQTILKQISIIKNEMKAHNWYVDSMPIVFTGGGSLLLKEYIEQEFGSYMFSENAIYDNALGIYKAGELALANKK